MNDMVETMTPSSLKKMSGGGGRTGGNYASSDPGNSSSNNDLGLTLLPGSQTWKASEEKRLHGCVVSHPKDVVEGCSTSHLDKAGPQGSQVPLTVVAPSGAIEHNECTRYTKYNAATLKQDDLRISASGISSNVVYEKSPLRTGSHFSDPASANPVVTDHGPGMSQHVSHEFLAVTGRTLGKSDFLEPLSASISASAMVFVNPKFLQEADVPLGAAKLSEGASEFTIYSTPDSVSSQTGAESKIEDHGVDTTVLEQSVATQQSTRPDRGMLRSSQSIMDGVPLQCSHSIRLSSKSSKRISRRVLRPKALVNKSWTSHFPKNLQFADMKRPTRKLVTPPNSDSSLAKHPLSISPNTSSITSYSHHPSHTSRQHRQQERHTAPSHHSSPVKRCPFRWDIDSSADLTSCVLSKHSQHPFRRLTKSLPIFPLKQCKSTMDVDHAVQQPVPPTPPYEQHEGSFYFPPLTHSLFDAHDPYTATTTLAHHDTHSQENHGFMHERAEFYQGNLSYHPNGHQDQQSVGDPNCPHAFNNYKVPSPNNDLPMLPPKDVYRYAELESFQTMYLRRSQDDLQKSIAEQKNYSQALSDQNDRARAGMTQQFEVLQRRVQYLESTLMQRDQQIAYLQSQDESHRERIHQISLDFDILASKPRDHTSCANSTLRRLGYALHGAQAPAANNNEPACSQSITSHPAPTQPSIVNVNPTPYKSPYNLVLPSKKSDPEAIETSSTTSMTLGVGLAIDVNDQVASSYSAIPFKSPHTNGQTTPIIQVNAAGISLNMNPGNLGIESTEQTTIDLTDDLCQSPQSYHISRPLTPMASRKQKLPEQVQTNVQSHSKPVINLYKKELGWLGGYRPGDPSSHPGMSFGPPKNRNASLKDLNNPSRNSPKNGVKGVFNMVDTMSDSNRQRLQRQSTKEQLAREESASRKQTAKKSRGKKNQIKQGLESLANVSVPEKQARKANKRRKRQEQAHDPTEKHQRQISENTLDAEHSGKDGTVTQSQRIQSDFISGVGGDTDWSQDLSMGNVQLTYQGKEDLDESDAEFAAAVEAELLAEERTKQMESGATTIMGNPLSTTSTSDASALLNDRAEEESEESEEE